jgi:hypothetical protein
MTLIAQTGDTMMSLPSSRHARITLAQRTSGNGSEVGHGEHEGSAQYRDGRRAGVVSAPLAKWHSPESVMALSRGGGSSRFGLTLQRAISRRPSLTATRCVTKLGVLERGSPRCRSP